MMNTLKHLVLKGAAIALLFGICKMGIAQSELPIADAHVHYSHDSVEMTPPSRVIELMRSANLKFALVSSSDDNGTQLLSELAPELIVPGLRPYRRRGEIGSWFKDPDALAYVEALLAKNQYASIGEFHLYGDSADLPIPRRIVELAEEYNLILHAHSDAEAVERLLAQSDTVKVIWAHSGFDDPAAIADLLAGNDRVWADLAFRSEVGSGGVLSDGWRKLFTEFPTRFMLGTDTYTPERIFYIPDHAEGARVWLNTLPAELAENIAWRNAFNLIMPVWEKNRSTASTSQAVNACQVSKQASGSANVVLVEGENYTATIEPTKTLKVSESASVLVTVCGDVSAIKNVMLDASMPMHGHGTNYSPEVSVLEETKQFARYQVNGVVLHMPGKWQWNMSITGNAGKETLNHDFVLD